MSKIVLLSVKVGQKGQDSEAERLLRKSRYETELVAMRSKERKEFKD